LSKEPAAVIGSGGAHVERWVDVAAARALAAAAAAAVVRLAETGDGAAALFPRGFLLLGTLNDLLSSGSVQELAGWYRSHI
jgi:hypothetical protein